VNTAPEPIGICGLCGAEVHATMLMGHLRGAHGIEDDIQTWPDGQPVVIDLTLEPVDFAPEDEASR